ncbi:hypothetical protein Tco_1537313, partial [Tanacetum coccineum]
SSDDDLPSWSIPLMDAYEPEAPLSPVHAPPLPEPASPTALLSDYLTDFEPAKEDPNEDPEDDLEEEPSEKEEEELSAPADSPPVGLYIDLPSEVEEDEVPSTPPLPTSHHHIIPLSQTGLRRARMSVQPQTPLPLAIDALIEEDIIPEADMPLRKKDRFPAQSQRIARSFIRVTRTLKMTKPNYGLAFLHLRGRGDIIAILLQLQIGRPCMHDRLGLTLWIVSVSRRLISECYRLTPEYYNSRGEMTMTCGLEPLDASRR